MKKLAVSLLLSCLFLSVDAKAKTETVADNFNLHNNKDVLVVAHRACWSAAPENTVAAIHACKRLGVDAVEIDVQLTKDRKLVVFHDRTIDRMTKASGKVADLTLEELKSYPLLERDGSATSLIGYPFETRHRIATLEEILIAAGTDLLINLEIKKNHIYGFEETFRASVTEAKRLGLEGQIFWKIPAPSRGNGKAEVPADQLYNSISDLDLTHVSPIIWEGKRSFADQLNDFSDTNVNIYEIVAKNLEYWPLDKGGKIIGSDKNRYMAIAVLPRWSGGLADEAALVDPHAAWGKLIDLGFGLIMTDRPEALIEYLRARGLRK